MPLRLSSAADADSRAIYLFGAAKFGIAVADRYAANLDRALSLVTGSPQIARVREEMGGNLRAYPIGSHVIVYRIENDDDVVVVRIRHGREDWQHDG